MLCCAVQDMTIRLCQELLPPEKAEQTVAKLTRKKQKDWPKVRFGCCCSAQLLSGLASALNPGSGSGTLCTQISGSASH
jgi:hypothetical protein